MFNRLPVDPVKALVSSFFFLVILALMQADAATLFFEDILRGRFEVLGFVAFNLFADAVSLLETRWVLQRGTEATLGAF